MKRVHLKKNEERRIRKGHLWVYSNEINDSLKSYEAGELVDVLDSRGNFVARGYINPHSLISVRILSHHQEDIDKDFFAKRLQSALEYRKRVAPSREAYRLVFSEGDFLPGLTIDRYGDSYAVQVTTAGMEERLDLVCDLLVEMLEAKTIVIRNDVSIRNLEELPLYKKTVRGQTDEPLLLQKDGITFEIDMMEGQKTGFYFDQWENYGRLNGLLKGGRVLDCFCYNGAWALHAARFGAGKVTGVDSSEKAIGWARRNAELSHLAEACDFLTGDVLDTMPLLAKGMEKFDCIILDPPAFVKSKAKMEEGLRGYYEINRQAFKMLNPQSLLVTCSCSHHVDRETFLGLVRKAAADARRRVKVLELRSQSPDHPILLSMQETEYLKCLFLAVE